MTEGENYALDKSKKWLVMPIKQKDISNFKLS
jgi:hypothetical protein